MKRDINYPFRIVGAIYSIILIILIGLLIYIDILPNKYIIICLCVLVFISIIILNILFKSKYRNTTRITTMIMTIIITICYAFVSYYLYNTIDFMSKVKSIGKQSEEYYIVVRNNSKFKTIHDIDDEFVYSLDIDDTQLELAKERLNKKVKIYYGLLENLPSLGNQLLSSSINVLFISRSQKEILDEDIPNFKNDTKILYKITIELNNQLKEEVVSVGEVFNIYISGIDVYGSISNVSRSDVNMIVTVDTKNHKLLFTSIPRDYYVTLHSKGAKDKLTHSGIYGVGETVSTIEDLLEISIPYYIRLNFTTLIETVDLIGGIDVSTEYNFRAQGYQFYKGNNHMNGSQALAFSRERKSFEDGDRQRVKNQQLVLEAIIYKITTNKTILTKYNGLLNSLEESFETNIPMNVVTSLVKEQLNSMPAWTVERISLDGYDYNSTTYTYGSSSVYVMLPDENTISIARKKINNM